MAALADDEVVEITLAQIPECFVFKAPPRTRADGWLAAEMKDQIWTGRLKIVQRGKEGAILLTGKDDGKLFAMCRITEGAVERVKDSSRYFVLKIENRGGQHAFVGLAFNDRNQAFDFNVTLQEFRKDVEREEQLAQGGGSIPVLQSKDFSIKQGEKIKINLGGAGAGKRRNRPKASTTGGKGGSGGLLAPPPADSAGVSARTGMLAPPPADSAGARAKVTSGTSGMQDMLGFDSFGSEPAPGPAQAQEAAAASPAPPAASAASDPFNMAAFMQPPVAQAPAATGQQADPFAEYNF